MKNKCSYCGYNHHHSEEFVCDRVVTQYGLPVSNEKQYEKFFPDEIIINETPNNEIEVIPIILDNDNSEYVDNLKKLISNIKQDLLVLKAENDDMSRELRVLRPMAKKAGKYKSESEDYRKILEKLSETTPKVSKNYNGMITVLKKHSAKGPE